ncbi:MAG: hypothetical protein HFF97_07700 [Oscillibacter sp.]|nr:hypothetical protein [uncultured Oscillibacter sp.]MCI9644592.1 hypothetical protein [Oscillibacter sp.]
MGHQALLLGFMEEFRKAQAKACKQDVEELKRAGLSDKLAGKEDTRQDEDEKFTI